MTRHGYLSVILRNVKNDKSQFRLLARVVGLQGGQSTIGLLYFRQVNCPVLNQHPYTIGIHSESLTIDIGPSVRSI